MKKFLFCLLAVAFVAGALAPIPGAEGKLSSYYSGDAVSYGGYIVIATTNTGELELFKLKPGESDLVKFANFTSYNERFSTPQNFTDVVLRQENDKLFAYAVDGITLFKYDISDLKHVTLINQVKDSSWDWFGGVTIISGKLATTGSRGVKMWRTDEMVVTDTYNIVNPGDKAFNTTPAGSDKYIFTLYEGKIRMFNRETRAFFTEIPLDFKWGSDWYKRSIYNDRADSAVYAVDDEALRKINFKGEIIKSFDHIGSRGFDVAPSANSNYIYFSDGVGVVKLRKSDLSPVDWRFTKDLGMGEGWAMGIKPVSDASGEKLVVFNNTSIIVLDSNLDQVKGKQKAAFVIATKEDTYPQVNEPLGLTVDRNHAAPGSLIYLRGQGFAAHETLTLKFATASWVLTADENGRFAQQLTVPSVTHRRTDISVKGKATSLSYNLGFEIE